MGQEKKTAQEILHDSYTLLQNKENWTQHALARRVDDSSQGFKLEPYSESSVRWCAVGALIKSSALTVANHYRETSRESTQAHLYLMKASHDLYQRTATSVNDQLGHEDILLCYQKALEYIQEDLSLGKDYWQGKRYIYVN